MEAASASVESDEVPEANCVAGQIPKCLANGAPNAMKTAFDRRNRGLVRHVDVFGGRCRTAAEQ